MVKNSTPTVFSKSATDGFSQVVTKLTILHGATPAERCFAVPLHIRVS